MNDETLLEDIRRLVFASPRPGIVCPFCGDADFDQIGLKSHIATGQCEPFNATLTPAEEQAAKSA